MNFRRLWQILLAGLFLAGCLGSPPPEWLNGRSGLYPEQAFLAGIGVGEDRLRAEDRARLELAKIFRVDISARDVSSETAIVGGGQSDYRQEASSRLVAITRRLLEGVRIAEVWRDPDNGSWHALAVLERSRVAPALRDEIAALDRRIGEEVRGGETATSPLRRLTAFRSALRLQQQRDGLAADLRVVDPVAVFEEPVLPPGELAARVTRLVGEVKLAVALENDRGEIVRDAVVRALGAEGLRLVPEAESNLLLRGRIEISGAGQRGSVAWRTATARIELLEDLQPYDALQVTVREGSQDEDRAETLARELLGRRLGEKLQELLGARPGSEP